MLSIERLRLSQHKSTMSAFSMTPKENVRSSPSPACNGCFWSYDLTARLRGENPSAETPCIGLWIHTQCNRSIYFEARRSPLLRLGSSDAFRYILVTVPAAWPDKIFNDRSTGFALLGIISTGDFVPRVPSS
jgi:hypothetical protein